VFGEKCKQVTIGQTELEYIVGGPENCDGYDLCASSKLRGTFNGTLLDYAYDADTYHVDEITYAFRGDGVIETTHGKLFLNQWSITDLAAPDGYAVHINVVGGTGRYEGATGWMAYFANFANTETTWGGEVCWGDEE
jgi:hypothetical protein